MSTEDARLDGDRPTGPSLNDVKAALAEKGYTWHSLGERSYIDADGVERYWLNGSMIGQGRGRLAKQPVGWFTLDALLAEKFAEGCR